MDAFVDSGKLAELLLLVSFVVAWAFTRLSTSSELGARSLAGLTPAPRAGTIHTVQDGFGRPSTMATELIDVCPLSELPPGERRLVEWEDLEIGVFNCGGELLAIEDRCSHDNGPLAEGELDEASCTVECPRHGSLFDLRTGRPRTLPAYVPVDTFPSSSRTT